MCLLLTLLGLCCCEGFSVAVSWGSWGYSNCGARASHSLLFLLQSAVGQLGRMGFSSCGQGMSSCSPRLSRAQAQGCGTQA